MIITLLSDLGTRDASVSVARAILMQQLPAAEVVDVSHHVAQYAVRQAAYLLLSAYSSFPKGTIHIIAVDTFGGPAPSMLLAKKDGHFFIAPDNGILPLAFSAGLENTRLCFEYSKPYSLNTWIKDTATVINTMQEGWVSPYRKCEVKNAPKIRRHKITPFGVDCNILYIDRYKNIVLDITRQELDKLREGRPFTVMVLMKEVNTVSLHYNEVEKEEPLCRFNRAGFLEIALNQAAAATFLGLDGLGPGDLRYQTIRIFF